MELLLFDEPLVKYTTREQLANSKKHKTASERGGEMFPLDNPKKVSSYQETWAVFFSNWNKRRLTKFKELKTMYIDNFNNAIALSEFSINKTDISLNSSEPFKISLAHVVDFAAQLGVSKVIIAESFRPMEVHKNRMDNYELINKVLKPRGVKLLDYYSISLISASSLKMQNALK